MLLDEVGDVDSSILRKGSEICSIDKKGMIDGFLVSSAEPAFTVQLVIGVQAPYLDDPFGVVSSEALDVATTCDELGVSMDDFHEVAWMLFFDGIDALAIEIDVSDIALSVDQQHEVVEVVPTFVDAWNAHKLALLSGSVDAQQLSGLFGY